MKYKTISEYEVASIDDLYVAIEEADENIDLYDRMCEEGLKKMWLEFRDTLYNYMKDKYDRQ